MNALEASDELVKAAAKLDKAVPDKDTRDEIRRHLRRVWDHVQETAGATASILTDVRYALRQLRDFREIDRAVDALERVEAELERGSR